MVEHLCKGSWVPGPIAECGNHRRQGRALNLSPLASRHNVVTEGVAKTGQVSPKGTVAHREWFDGRVDAKASPRPVSVKLSDLKRMKHES